MPSELLRESLLCCNCCLLAIDRRLFSAEKIAMASQFIQQKLSSRPPLQNTHTSLKLLNEISA